MATHTSAPRSIATLTFADRSIKRKRRWGKWIASLSTALLCTYASSTKLSADEFVVVGATSANVSPSLPVYVSTEDVAAPTDWKSILEGARKELNPERFPSIAQSQSDLKQALLRLESFLNGTSIQNRDAWTKFLRLDELKGLVDNPESTSAQFLEAEIVFSQNYPGLELKPFTDVRDSLGKMYRAVRFSKNPEESIKFLDGRLAELEEHLVKDAEGSGLHRSRELGLILKYLWQGNQTPSLQESLRKSYLHPNVQVAASEGFLQNVVGRSVNESQPVCEVILGTSIRGQSQLDGIVTPRLVSNPNAAQIELALTGCFTSNNVGTKQGVVLHSRGMANVSASRTIYLTGDGMSTGSVQVDADLNTQIDSIEHNLKIVRKLASKRAAQMKPQAEAIGEERLEGRIARQFSEQVDSQVSQSNSRLGPDGSPAMKRLGVAPPDSYFSTTEEHLFWTMTQAAEYQLSAPFACPIPMAGGDLVARVHQSALMNVTDVVLGGRTIRNKDLPELAKQFVGKVPDELKKDDDGPWSITMAQFHPVELDLKDGNVTVTIRLSQMTRGDDVLDDALTVSATYAPVETETGVQLVRQGEVAVEILGRQGRGARAVALQTFIKGKFNQLFRERLLDKPLGQDGGIQFSGALGERVKGMKPLRITELQTNSGWLQISLQ